VPLSAIKVFEIFEEVGFAKGVVNLILGSRPVVGNEIAMDRSVCPYLQYYIEGVLKRKGFFIRSFSCQCIKNICYCYNSSA